VRSSTNERKRYADLTTLYQPLRMPLKSSTHHNWLYRMSYLNIIELC
jgi:hypothetical protein